MLGPAAGSLNAVDVLLIVYLVLVIPFLQAWRSLRPKEQPSLHRRVATNFMVFGIPLVLLAGNWIAARRSAAMLGFDLPLTTRGEIGLGIAALTILGLTLSSYLWPVGGDPVKEARMRARMSEGGMLITSPGEWGIFVPLAFLIGCGTEVLFRGFLWSALSPAIGAAGAVIVAALAYGIAHGVRGWAQTAGSVASAFAFTIAYALTLSLWWLMILHTAAAFFGAWTGYRLAHMHSDSLVPDNP